MGCHVEGEGSKRHGRGSLRKWCEVRHSLWDRGHQGLRGQKLGALQIVQTSHFWASEFTVNLTMSHILNLKHYTVKPSLHSSEWALSNRKQSEIININYADTFHFPFSKKKNSVAMPWHSFYIILHTCKKAHLPVWDTETSIQQAQSECWHRGLVGGGGASDLWHLACGDRAASWKTATSHPKECTLVTEHPDKQVPLLVTDLKENKSWPQP